MALSSPASTANPQAELDDHYLVALAKEGRTDAYDQMVRRYRGFVRLKASSYFLLGGESDDLIQEGLLGLYKAIRDYRTDRESSFRSFAELCITRQIITAVKTATRNKHTPLNQYVSFSQTPAAAGDSDTTLDEILPGPSVADPVNQVIATEELASLVSCLSGHHGRPLRPREQRPLPLPRRPLLRDHGGAPRVRHEDRRQRPAARKAQGRRPPRLPRGARLSLMGSVSIRAATAGDPSPCRLAGREGMAASR